LAPLGIVAQAGYGAALLAVAAATLFALALDLGAEPGIFAPFLVAVVGVALWYGIGPALVTILASGVVVYVWFFAPLMSLSFDPSGLRRLALFRLGIFAGAGVAITLIAEAHRQTLQQLERSRRQLRAFTADDSVGLQVIDHEGRITWADNVTARVLGYEPSEFVGSTFARFHADAKLADELQACLVAGKPIENVRATLLKKDGVTQDALINSNHLLGDAGVAGSGVLVAVMPLAHPVAAIDGTKLAVSFLLERRRKAAAERPPAVGSSEDHRS